MRLPQAPCFKRGYTAFLPSLRTNLRDTDRRAPAGSIPDQGGLVYKGRDDRKVTEIRAVFDRETKKAKTYIQWVPSEESGSLKAEVRLYERLFKSDNPTGFLDDINPRQRICLP